MQVLLVLLAYQVFSKTIASLMEHGEVGYDMFAAIAFKSGTFASWITLARHTIGLTPVPRTSRAVWAYLGMTTATLYIICVPSLISAVTGYVPHYSTWIRTNAGYDNATVTPCPAGLLPVWGQLSTTVHDLSYETVDTDLSYFPIVDDRYPWTGNSVGREWIECGSYLYY